MKTNTPALTATLAALTLCLAPCTTPAADLVRFGATPNSKVVIAGDSTVHHWTMEGEIIGGYIALDPALANPDGQLAPGKINAQAEVTIPVRSLKSTVEAGKTLMESIMQEKMKYSEYKAITYHLTELTLKAVPSDKKGPYEFDSKGDLTVAGVKKTISMPVKMVRVSPVRLQFTCSMPLKMTDFGVEPPAPKIGLGAIKTSDDVTISIDWVTLHRP
jgi:YceI-like domain